MADSSQKRVLIYPGLKDPRWIQLIFTFSFVAYALAAPGFSRTPMQWVAGVVTCLSLDFLLAYFYRGLLLLPMSGLITSMGLLLLCDSPHLWPYPVCGALAILSKHFLRLRGKHFFNPINFGIVVGLLFFSGSMTVIAGRWGGGLAGMAFIAALGLFTVYRAKRLDLCLTFIVTFLAGAGIRTLIAGGKFLTVVSPIAGASFQLFTFFMISDPMTTPETRRGRIVYAIILGALDAVLRYAEIRYSPFYALFIIAGLMPAFRRLFAPQQEEKVWVPHTIALGGK